MSETPNGGDLGEAQKYSRISSFFKKKVLQVEEEDEEGEGYNCMCTVAANKKKEK